MDINKLVPVALLEEMDKQNVDLVHGEDGWKTQPRRKQLSSEEYQDLINHYKELEKAVEEMKVKNNGKL